MRSAVTKISSLLLVLVLAFGCLGITVLAEDEELPVQENGNMNLDVVFVVDSSGSMAEADPNRVAIDAFNLFVDLCDDSCGVGYTVYSEQIKESQNITMLDKKQLASLKDKMSQINRNPYGDTDIALGLTTAMNIHKRKWNTDSSRKKLIILLSDGNTHLISGPRTVEESKKELETTLQALSDAEIPVYAIGLNYDGTLDKKETQKIASATGGKNFEAKESNELPAIISDIFADIYEIKGDKKTIKNGDVDVDIKDQSVSYVNLVIRTRLSFDRLNPTLFNPKHEKADINDKNQFIVTSTDSYILIKMLSPISGKWTLHLDNATDENCNVSQLDFYSLFVKQELPQSAIAGQVLRITASLNESNDKIITDTELLDTVSMKSTILNSGETQELTLALQPDGTFAGEFIPKNTGNYLIQTTAQSPTFQKGSPEYVLTVRHYSDEELKNATAPGGNLDPDGLMPDTTALHENFHVSPVIVVLFIIGILAVIGILIFLFVKLKREKDKQALSLARASYNAPSEEKPAPPAPPIEKVKEGPKAEAPDYVDIPLVEHGSLESLIKKGPDDAFHVDPDAYKTDSSLESIIKKGPDTNLGVGTAPLPEEDYSEFDNSHNEDYQTGQSLSDMMGDSDDTSPDGFGFIKRD